MKTIHSFFVFVVFLIMEVCSSDDTQNLDTILINDTYHRSLLHCVMDKEECLDVTKTEIDMIQEAVKTLCGKCSDFQKIRYRKFIFSVKEKYPEEYDIFRQKYDPENMYLNDFEDYISKY